MKIRASRLLAVATALAVTASVAACGNLGNNPEPSTNNSEKGPVTIGVLVDQTAYLKTLDGGVLSGIEKAVKTINDKGGVLDGRKLQIVTRDMAADPQTEIQAFQFLQGRDKPAIYLNGFSSAGNAAVAPLAESQKVPMIVASVVPATNFDWMFSTITPVKFETGTRVTYLEAQGVKKVAILHDPTPYNKSQVDIVEKQLADAGIEVTGVAEHASDAVDLRPQISKLLSGSPQAIIKLSTGATQIVAAKALADAGSTVPLLLGIESRANLVQASAVYPHVLAVAAPLQVYSALKDSERSAATKSFVTANPDADDPTYVGRGWDAVFIAAAAINQAKSTDGQAVRDALVSMGAYEGTSGSYDYTDTDHYGITINPDYLAKITDTSVEIITRPGTK